ncbi:hypothetical protein M3194_15025 [Paenibacillus glycanilyticus]|uniref:hypothetical protein n=1 Tax=Paenibacillus glycanilyticus TaxID=126569 RepID=UPI00203EE5F3|nr:hypothetical protein [Paenibacillus glycanilyticus]MCM3628674.1 hypothetical protein [Paenibacillus glycanilyticus]
MKLIHVTLVIAAAILMGTFFLMNQQYHKAKQMESSLQGLLGSAIYQIWSSYNDLEKYPPDEVNRERLNQINEKLSALAPTPTL